MIEYNIFFDIWGKQEAHQYNNFLGCINISADKSKNLPSTTRIKDGIIMDDPIMIEIIQKIRNLFTIADVNKTITWKDKKDTKDKDKKDTNIVEHDKQFDLAEALQKAPYNYEIKKEHHDHLICTKCGKIVEFNNPAIEKMQEKVSSEYNFRLTTHVMTLFGECLDDKCQENKD